MPKCCSRRWEWRVSSAAISATSRSTRRARALMSSRLPMGVATTYSTPADVGSATKHLQPGKSRQCTRFANSTSQTRPALSTIQSPYCLRIGTRPMTSCLRPLLILCLLGLLAACSGTARPPAGDLPRTPQASVDELLLQASRSAPREAALLRLAADDKAHALGNPLRAAHIIQQVPHDQLGRTEQALASILNAELSIWRERPQAAWGYLQHPSLEPLGRLPTDLQRRAHVARASALEATNQLLEAVRERVLVAPLLSGQAARDNHEAIWPLIARLNGTQLASPSEGDLAGWLRLGIAVRDALTVETQQAALERWLAANPQHPAA